MDKFEKLLEVKKPELFQLLTGVTREVFQIMLNVLEEEYNLIHKKGGNPNGTSAGLRLVIALEYWREYRSIRHMAFDYGLAASTICNSIQWVEDVLSKAETFQTPDLKGKFKRREEEGDPVRVVIIDVEEQPIEGPTENQETHYSGKKNGTRPNTKY
jgi:hypothetical protein